MIGSTPIGRFGRGFISAATLVAAAFLLAPTSARAEDTAEIERLFREAVDLYERGQYGESQQRLESVLKKDIRQALAARLVDEAGVGVMARMMADARMSTPKEAQDAAGNTVTVGTPAARIWQLYRKYYVGKLADTKRMAELAKRLVNPQVTEQELALLYREFAELGHYAVPTLAAYLKESETEDYRTKARLAIEYMGARAVLPVIELLNSKDKAVRQSAAMILARVKPADPRALPALKARIEDPNETATTKDLAKATMRAITGLENTEKTAAEFYYDLSNRYYLDRPGVAEEAEDVDGMVWHLNEAGDLISITYPLWAWNDQMAEENALRGMSVAADPGRFFPLWACIQGAQYTEIKDLLDFAGEQPKQHSFSDEEVLALKEWDKKAVQCRRLAAAVGRESMNAAVNKVLNDVRKYPGHGRVPQVGVYLAGELAALDPLGDLLSDIPADAKGPSSVTSGLINGLDSPDLGVQYACALALAKIDRFPAKWAGADKVGAVLGRGMAENKSLQILLVEENPNAANETAGRLRELGYGVTVAISGRDALTQARAYPPKDLAILSSALRRDFTTDQVIEEFRADTRTRYIPVGVLHLTAERTIIQSRFGPEMATVERENTGNDLKVAVEKIAAKQVAESLPKRKAREIAVACATALTLVDPRDTHIALDAAAAHAVDALVNRPLEVRIPAAIFLGRIEGGSQKAAAGETLKRVFEDTNSPVELRRAALRSLGRVQQTGLEELYVKAQADADQEIKDIGAQAFGQLSRDAKATVEFLKSQRTDKDAKEK